VHWQNELEALSRRLAATDPEAQGMGCRADFRNAKAVCEHCGTVFEAKATGRPRRYHSNACRQAAYRARRSEDEAAEDGSQ
jgi:hypothetical protein